MPTYPDISSQAFKHPLDQQAEQALRSVPGFDLLAKSFSEYLYERPQQILLMGNDLKVGPRQYDITLGLGKAITTGLVYAFYEWRRKAELSADRAALLVTDDLNLVLRTLMKCAGGSQKYLHECNLEEFIRQGEAYRQLDQDNLNQIYKFIIYNGGNGSFLTHPFSVERVHYLQEWFNSESYRQIRRGNYAKTGVKSSINVDANDRESERLQRQIAELQAEIERAKRQRNPE